MSIKNRIDAQTDALSALLVYANDATQAGDTDIGEAIRTLVDGYGKGGDSPVPTIDGHKVYIGEVTPTEVGGFTLEFPFKTDKIYFGAIWLSDYTLASNHATENIMLASTYHGYTDGYASIYYLNSGRRDATYKSSYGFRVEPINPNTVRVRYGSYANWPMQTEKYYYMFVYDGEGDGKSGGLLEEIPLTILQNQYYGGNGNLLAYNGWDATEPVDLSQYDGAVFVTGGNIGGAYLRAWDENGSQSLQLVSCRDYTHFYFGNLCKSAGVSGSRENMAGVKAYGIKLP